MQNKKLIRFVESLVLLPIATMSNVPVGPISQATINIVSNTEIVSVEKLNMPSFESVFNQNASEEKVALDLKDAKAEAINAYFREHEMPLAGFGMKMVEEAEKNELDWRLIPAIAMRESTGGKHACKKVPFSPFGWGSCKIGFKSYDHAIEVVAHNLGGNNPRTARYYDEKTTIQILRAYNPPSIVPKYAEQVISIMNKIGAEDMGREIAMNIR